MDVCVSIDYSVKETCCWEPQGNGHFLTRCGNLVFDRSFSPTKDMVCRKCHRPFDDTTYINVHEPVPILSGRTRRREVGK